MYIVVCYDISEDKRRTKIHSLLKSYGEWVQFSVFECRDLTDTQYAKMRSRRVPLRGSRLAKLIQPDQDSILFYFLCGCCRGKVERIGTKQPMDTTVFFA